MTFGRTRVLAVAMTFALAVSSGLAWAYWGASGAGSASATSATFDPATISVPGSATNSVTVTWTQPASLNPPSAANSDITYAVERRLGAGSWGAVASGGCSGAMSYATTSCADAPDTAGSYTYRAVASFRSWTATSAASGAIALTIDVTAPTVQSIDRLDSSPTNAASARWTVTFDEAVSGVGSGDFALAQTGVSGSAITSVSGSGASYTVTASTGSGDGTLGVNLVDDDSIVDAATNKLGGTGTGNGNLTGQLYTLDRTAPAVSSIVRVGSTPSNASSLQWTVEFSESVTGVGSGDFALAQTGVSGASITAVSGSGSSFTVTASTGSGDGTLGVNLVDDDSIVDAAANRLGGTGAGNGNLAGQLYTLDRTAPAVSSIVRVGSTPSNASSVQWTVAFSESVTGVGSGDFALAQTGVSGASITAVSGSGSSFTVTASTGSGDGTLGLNLVDDDTIVDAAANKLGGTGTGNGNLTGQTYGLDLTAPAVSSIVRVGSTPSNASSVQWTVTFGESVTGVGSGDFALAQVGVSGASITSVSGSGSSFTVTASTGSGAGTVGLNLVDDDTILDTVANKLGGTGTANGNFTGQTYSLDLVAPTVVSIARSVSTPTNAGSVQWTASFSESVSGVGSGDFAVAQTGVTGASISSVSGSGASYTVTASTGTGDGTLGLNLVDDDSIVDAVANKLGGTGTGNGNLTGQTYTIDKTAPAQLFSAAVTSGAVARNANCGVAATTRYVNVAGKAAVLLTATFAAAPLAGDTVNFSVSTPGSTPVTATVAASPPSTAVTATLDLGSAAFLDGTATFTATVVDLAGNLSTAKSPAYVVVKDTVLPPLTAAYHVTGGGGLGLSSHVDGSSECGATIDTSGSGTYSTTISSGSAYDIVVGLLGVLATYDVTSTDVAGNAHAAIRVP